MKFSSVIIQNPNSICPDEIMNTLEVIDVRYRDFEGKGRLSEIVVAASAVAGVSAFFNNAFAIGFPIHEVAQASEYDWDDEKLMAANITSGFNYRTIEGTHTLSQHARGLAFDVNPMQNPYIRYTDTDKNIKPAGSTWNQCAPGTLHKAHKLVVLMKNSGWIWGGDWPPSSGSTDYQHFEKAR